MARVKKKIRQEQLIEKVKVKPFLTDEELARQLDVSVQTIRLDRLELGIPELRGRIRKMDTRFNESVATGYTEEPAVVHYAGYNRHWAGNIPRFEFYLRYKQFERH